MAGLLDWVDPAREWWKSRPEVAKGLLSAAYQMATDPAARSETMARQPKPFTDESAAKYQGTAENFWNPSGLLGMARQQAKLGGEIAASNGYFYRGGQFLPSTSAEPGAWKINGKTVKTGKAQIEPSTWEVQPTPLSRPIYELIGGWTEKTQDGIQLRRGVLDHTGGPIAPETPITPGVKGFLGKTQYKIQDLIDQYNSGNRWINVDVDLPPELIVKGK